MLEVPSHSVYYAPKGIIHMLLAVFVPLVFLAFAIARAARQVRLSQTGV